MLVGLWVVRLVGLLTGWFVGLSECVCHFVDMLGYEFVDSGAC